MDSVSILLFSLSLSLDLRFVLYYRSYPGIRLGDLVSFDLVNKRNQEHI